MDEKALASIRKRVAQSSDNLAVITPWGSMVTTGRPAEIDQVNRTNLLIRNEAFIAEATRIYRRLKKHPKKRKRPWLDKGWRDFCNSWRIQRLWDGDVADLHIHVSCGTELFFKDHSGSRGNVSIESVLAGGEDPIYTLRSSNWPDYIHKETAFIYLKLKPQTTRADLIRMWPVFKEIRAHIWKGSERKKRTFARDLMFFDLHSYAFYGPLTYGQLARRQRMDKAKIQLACKRISEAIRRVADISY